ncbi:FtsX-like permease family protein [Streptomyces pristinaespiralis]|uniref:ABC transporter permease n=1 Tax=Streptomyces pristinaespiralis TaxID=38300 RepID=A0A0M5IQY8_STRPR|nr:ABC transporter permease [Streptomyces pristinaespiralis]ALC21761.1 ABC transporter permease [Streptomyces pristinaespiralis]QMU15548.1 ABC transporter permease [Streptomyces pristinaespiralis]
MLTVALASLRARRSTFTAGFVALALGVGLIATMGLGLASTLEAPRRPPERFASSPVVVMGQDRLTVEVRRGPGTEKVSKPLAHPHPVDSGLVRELARLGRVTRDGGTDAVGVDAPADRVTEVVGDRAQVLTGDERRRADPGTERDAQALVSVNSLLGTAGGVSAFVSVFVVASTFAFAVALRRREFGLLRTAGATPGQIRRLLLTESLVVGALASAAGCALGAWGAPRLARALVEGQVAPEWFAIREDVNWPFHVAFWTGLLVALTGVWAASRRAGRIGPAEALREADVDTGVLPRGRLLAGIVLAVAGVALLGWGLATDPADLLKRKTYLTRPMILITAVALLAPLLVRRTARLLPLPGAVGMLVRENTVASVRRTAAVAAPVLVTVALAGSMTGTAESVTAARAADARERTTAQLVVTGERLRMPRPTAVTPATRQATVSPSASTAVYVREEGTALVGFEARAVTDPAAFAKLARLPVTAGDLRDLDDRSIVVTEEWMRPEVGRTGDVWLGDGRPAELRIAAVLAIGTGGDGAFVTAANAPTASVDRVDVRAAPGASPATLDALATELRSSFGGTVREVDEWAAATHPRTSPQTRLGMLVVLGIALVYTAIALAGTLLMATSARAGELASLRLAGATRAQVLRMVTGEALLAVAVGAVLGAAITAVNLGGLGAALAALSAPVTVVVPWGTAGAALGACATVAVLAALVSCPRTR